MSTRRATLASVMPLCSILNLKPLASVKPSCYKPYIVILATVSVKPLC
jgi:hypothetical protein